MHLFSVIPQPLGILDSPTFAGLTITGNSVFGLNSSVFQPAAGGDSATFVQILNAAGTQVMAADTTNRNVIIGTGSPTAKLEIADSENNRLFTLRNTTTGASINIHPVDTRNWEWRASSSIDYKLTLLNSSTGEFNFSVFGDIGIGEPDPETLTEWTGVAPYLTLHNSTHEDTDGGGESRLIFKREDGAGTETACAQIEASHDGSGANDQLGRIIEYVNTGAGLVEARRLDSNLNDALAKIMRTAIGGYAIKLTNNTGVNSVEGQLVEADDTDENSYKKSDANALDAIGVVYNAGIADGSEVWIVVAGIAEVLLDAGGCVHHDRLITSATAGSADVSNTPAVAVHFQEIGHAIETVVGAGLAKAVIHFL